MIDIDKELAELKGEKLTKQPPICPRCLSKNIRTAGCDKKGRRQYRCKVCNRWFIFPKPKKHTIKPRCHPDRKYKARGLCDSCYQRKRIKEGYVFKDKIIICKECGKEKKHEAFGLCRTCYSRSYYKKNHNKIRSYHRKSNFKESRKQQIRKTQNKWRKANPDKVKKYNENYKHKRNYKKEYEVKRLKRIQERRKRFLAYEKEMRGILYMKYELNMTQKMIGEQYGLSQVAISKRIINWFKDFPEDEKKYKKEVIINNPSKEFTMRHGN